MTRPTESYIEGYVVVEGALDEERTFDTFNEFREWAQQVIYECATLDLHADVYYVLHEHPQDVDECECVQYLTSHQPYMSI